MAKFIEHQRPALFLAAVLISGEGPHTIHRSQRALVETIMQKFGTLPGSRMYSNFFRGKLREQAFIDDKEDIPPGAREVVSKRLAPSRM